MTIIDMKGVKKDYLLGKTKIHALGGIDLDLEEGDFTAIAGPSGCGKTTLLNILGCIDLPTGGEVRFDGHDLSKLTDRQSSDLRLRRIGFIFQSFNLIPVLTAAENVEFPMIVAGVPKSERRKRVGRLLELVGLPEFAAHRPDELSGGQRQRVAIARAFANNPGVIIADEPTANLDSETGDVIVRELKRLNLEEKVTIIYSTHNPDILVHARRIIRLKDGFVTGDGR